jgi:hypothetical protein
MTVPALPSVINETPTRAMLKNIEGIQYMSIALKVARNIHMRCRLAEAQNWKCCWCGIECIPEPNRKNSATIEHVTPRSLGGADEWENFAMACASCNHRRGTASVEDMLAGRVKAIQKKVDNQAARKMAQKLRKYELMALKLQKSGWVRGERKICPDAWLAGLRLPADKKQVIVMIVKGEALAA